MDDKIYLPVEGVTFKDLFNWQKPNENCKTRTGLITGKSLRQQKSQTGSLVDCNKKDVALFRYGEHVFAIDEYCPHAGGPLHLGDIELLPDHSLCVKCPWHNWRMDLKSGKVKRPKGSRSPSTVYPVSIKENGTIYVGFDAIDAQFFTGAEF